MAGRTLAVKDHSVVVPITNQALIGPNPLRLWVSFVVHGANDIHIRLGSAATLTTGKLLKADGGAFILDMATTPWYGEINAIAETVASLLLVEEVEEMP